MYGRCLEAAKEEVVPESFDLHVLMRDESQIDKHVEADHELGNPSGIPVALDEEGKGKGEGSPDIAEVEEIEEVFLREPERDAHCLEDSKQTDWYGISLHPSIPFHKGGAGTHSTSVCLVADELQRSISACR